ncbi:1,4-alpha-glucan branching enzyme, partial [Streptomyces sp. SID10244]|nr:1,4-alpha-glucan branching enzyme [Streptomyces sp. SID10244]
LWDVLGARVVSYTTPDGEVRGTAFSVWAPNAHGVAVIGDFDNWTGRRTPMRQIGSSGIWEVFVPDVTDGERYKFRVHGADGVVRDKADP